MEALIRLLIALLTMALAAFGGSAGAVPPAPPSDRVVRQARHVSGFDGVDLEGIGTAVITQGATESLTIEGEASILSAITTEVRNHTLVIGFSRSVTTNQPLTFYISVKQLTAVTVSGSGSIEASRITTDRLTASVKGSGDISLAPLTADELRVSIAGSGDFTASGKVTREEIELSGSGGVQANDLDCGDATVAVRGSGTATVRVRDRLDARITGSGDIEYIGQPSVNQQVTGSGRVTQAGS